MSQGGWKVVSGLLLVAAAALGVLWWQGTANKVDRAVADSLRQENAALAATVDSLRAMPAETVYAAPGEAPPGAEAGQVARWRDSLAKEVAALASVLPDTLHPAYADRVRALRRLVDRMSR